MRVGLKLWPPPPVAHCPYCGKSVRELNACQAQDTNGAKMHLTAKQVATLECRDNGS